MVRARRIKHPRRQHADRVIRQPTEHVFTVAILLATTHGQELTVQWMPAVAHPLKTMGIMSLIRPAPGKTHLGSGDDRHFLVGLGRLRQRGVRHSGVPP